MAGMMDVARRAVLRGALAAGALLALAGCASVPNAPATESALAREVVSLPGSGSAGDVQAVMWTPPDPRAVALLAVGGDSRPNRYQPLVERLAGMGMVVIAPDEPDLPSPSPERETREGVSELGAAALYAKDRYAGMPILAVGHGSGSLAAMALGRALAEEGAFNEPTPRGVIAFSVPASTPQSSSESVVPVGVPLLLLGGDRDPVSVEGLATSGSGEDDAYALVLAGGGPDLVGDAAFVERAWPVVDLFVQAYLFDIFTAGDVLGKWTATGEDRFVARRGSQ